MAAVEEAVLRRANKSNAAGPLPVKESLKKSLPSAKSWTLMGNLRRTAQGGDLTRLPVVPQVLEEASAEEAQSPLAVLDVRKLHLAVQHLQSQKSPFRLQKGQ